MNILICVDMEGITGVTQWDHVTLTHPEYQRFRRLMTGDVNAAVRGVLAGGAENVIVSDGHWDGTNILIEELDPRARLNCGSPSPFSMVQGVAGDVQALLFIGYHARAGSQNAILDHTWSSARVANLWLNGRLCGEIGLNASVAGYFNNPVLMISGDQTACAEAQDWIPGIETAIVKQASGRNAAECLPPAVSQARIEAAAKNAMLRLVKATSPAPLTTVLPCRITIEFKDSDLADRAVSVPGAERLDGRKVEIISTDMAAAYKAFRALILATSR